MVRLRDAERSDWGRLYAWRNDERTREQSISPDPVSLADHLKWLDMTLKKPKTTRLYIADDLVRSVCVGTGRLDLSGKRVELSLTVDPGQRGCGYATAIITALAAQAATVFPHVTLWARVRPENFASLRAFADAGFYPSVSTGEYIELEAM